MRAAKVDRNQKEIVAALRNLGATVIPLHAVGKGCPDLLVGYRGINYLLEVKMPDGKLTPDQVVLHGSWNGHISVVHSITEAVEALRSVPAGTDYDSAPEEQSEFYEIAINNAALWLCQAASGEIPTGGNLCPMSSPKSCTATEPETPTGGSVDGGTLTKTGSDGDR